MTQIIKKAIFEKKKVIISISVHKKHIDIIKPELNKSKLTMSSFIDFLLEDYIKRSSLLGTKEKGSEKCK